MLTYIGVCPSSGGMQVKEIEVKAENTIEALELIRAELFGSFYVSSIYMMLDGTPIRTWQE